MDKFDIQYRPNYDPHSVQYMRDELTAVGFSECLTLDDIDRALLKSTDETVLLVINSVCGCAAGSARPGVAMALQHRVIPDRLVTVFAGMEKKTVEYLRQRFLSDFLPSSPLFAIFRSGQAEFVMQRKDIVNKSPEEIAGLLTTVFDRMCSKAGPSISPEEFSKLENIAMCSSNIPKYQGS
ncbi:MAG: BrxA/BrxB family bacilliredoxin [Calditrichaeota bacterium]|nr:BrxA/BrxB family bacilliredoxin [Calditrichota bacterium]RQW01372.1 MAG: BrxA/BrxB family bacilliredoxin [Calditrichota bacterium]